MTAKNTSVPLDALPEGASLSRESSVLLVSSVGGAQTRERTQQSGPEEAAGQKMGDLFCAAYETLNSNQEDVNDRYEVDVRKTLLNKLHLFEKSVAFNH